MFCFAIDRGGTFTDVWCRIPSGKVIVRKLLSEDPENYVDAPREAIRRILSEFMGTEIPKGSPIPTEKIQWIRMGTTVATNALLERKGERFALLVTKGFRNLLYIGNQARPDIFDLSITMPEMLYDCVVEVDERVMLGQPGCRLPPDSLGRASRGVTGEPVHVAVPLDCEKLRAQLVELLGRGIRGVAVLFLHSYLYPEHELEAGRLAQELGFGQVSLSHRVMPMVRAVPRGHTACADAYLTPCIDKYIAGFAGGFQGGLQNLKVLFMQSDGGLAPVNEFNGSRAILSGPAGGVVGYALTTHPQSGGAPVIGFDMGGTSTDVSRYDGQLEHVFETTTAGVAIQAPQLDINTVAAGGGSRLFFRSGLFVVGPESAGAHPGPVCYRKGGPLTVTDANLVLGRLLPEYFPKIFGPNADLPLDADGARQAMSDLTHEINSFLATDPATADSPPMTLEDVALGFVRVANESMCRPIRALTQAKGHNTARHVLACFGGAGGQHACAIARSLGMSRVFVHKHSGILSAYGLALADVVHEAQVPCALEYCPENVSSIKERFQQLESECLGKLTHQGFDKSNVSYERYLHMRYDGTDCALMCRAEPEDNNDYLPAFLRRYSTEFGFTLDGRRVLVDDVRVRGVATSCAETTADTKPREVAEVSSSSPPTPVARSRVYFEGVTGWQTVGVHRFDGLTPGQTVVGPAVVLERNSTVLVEPGCRAQLTRSGDLMIQLEATGAPAVSDTTAAGDIRVDSIQLSIFSHRFMSIAEQMGRVLQRTSISTNIKERLDFSCALFGPDGGLVANAPHIPVHLGAMQETVRYQMQHCEILPGDVILANHPRAGGSHLPDLTVITPVFLDAPQREGNQKQPKPIFFVANRGHHADIGGRTPGSMPPDSHSILEEGAVFCSFHLVRGGRFLEAEVTAELMRPAELPGCSGTRNLTDNLSDLRAQVAANQKGVALVLGLIEEYGLPVVQAYMTFIQANAETAVRDLLKHVGAKQLTFVDSLDDGSDIRLTVDIDPSEGSAVFDFAGTSLESHGNLNAPRAVTMSALIYCLRCLVPYSIPLNQGCLAPIKLRLPDGSLLSPSDEAAVVGGNVLTSQRIVDVILGAFGACAASQGCMNNITFGDDSVGYYETVAGGSGAGPTWHGRSGVHTHMTNTRITDVEILERRYPVIVDHFSLCPGTGGRGQHNGGDGVLRILRFRRDLQLSVLTERRVHAPYGLKGGHPGSRGLNTLEVAASGRRVNLGPKASVGVAAGDRFLLRTPGGGGFGDADEGDDGKAAATASIGASSVLRGSLQDYAMMQFSA